MLSNMRLSTKLICAFGLLIVLQIAGSVISLFMLGNINKDVTELATNWLPSIDNIFDIDHNFQSIRRQELLHILSTDAATMRAYEQEMDKFKQALTTSINTYEPLISSDAERRFTNVSRET